MKNKFVIILSVLFVCSCSNQKINSHIEYELPNISYNSLLKNLPEVKDVNSMQDLSNFVDYVVFYSTNEDFVYTNVTDEYKEVLLNDLEYQIKWACQYASIGHNFVKGYDASKLNDNLIGISGYISNYGFKSYEEEVNNVVTFEYYQDVLSKNKYQNKDGNKLPLYKYNNGFIEVNNSEQLFYACMNNYFPYCKKETKAYACYFLEGVFDHHTAVCDGLTKAVVLLSRLEGIEAYHIGAVSKIGGHAYCYVKINDQYYLSCPTSGSNIETKNNIKYHVHNNLFLLTSYYTSSTSWDYDSEAFPNIKQKVIKSDPFDYYDNYYVNMGQDKYSLHIKDVSTGNKILKYVENIAKENDLCLQIELLGSYEIMSNIWQNYNNQYNFNFVNNGMFKKEKAYTFFFDYRK